METNWLQLWHELAKANFTPKPEMLVQRYERHAEKRAERPDPLLDFVIKDINNRLTVLDIGAGTGRWTLPLSQKAKKVTAVEPLETMSNRLRERLVSAGSNNVQIISSTWEEANVQPHDIAVCAHSMYGSPDFAAFVRKMEDHAVKKCYLALRLLPADGIMGELSEAVYGCWHDSPDAIIAYNALHSMGIYANVLVEEGIYKWVNSTFEEAFARAKRHLQLDNITKYDTLIQYTLRRRLTFSQGEFVWPDGMRSALLWWSPHRNPQEGA